MTPMLPSPFLQPAPPDEPAVATASLSHLGFYEACEQLQALAGLPEALDLDLESARCRFAEELGHIVNSINEMPEAPR